MNSIGQLGQLYNLSPATLAGLANAAGQPPLAVDTADDWQASQGQAAAAAGLPPVAPMAPNEGNYAEPSNNPRTIGTAPNLQLTGGPLGDPGAGGDSRKPLVLPEDNRVAAGSQVEQVQAMPAAPAQTVPAHWQPGTHGVTVARGMDPNALAPGLTERGAAFRSADQAGTERLEAAKLNEAADVEMGQRAAVQQVAAQNQMMALTARRDRYVRDEQAKLEALSAEAQKKVDPNEAFVGGEAGRMASALLIGIGAFASLWKGGPNMAMQIVNDGINRTIDTQKANIAAARGAFADRKNMYRDNMDAFGAQRGELATKIQLLDKVAQMADERRSGAKSLETDAAYNDFMTGIHKQKAEALDEFGKLTTDRATEQMNEHFVAAQTTGGASSMKREGNLVTLSDGTTFVMPSDKTADKAIEKIQNLDTLQRRNNQILQLRAEATKLDPILDRTEYQKKIGLLQELADEKVALMSIGVGQGTVKEDEYKRAQEFAANATNGLGFFKGNPLAAQEREKADYVLRAQTKKWADDQRAHVTSAGGAVYERGYATDKQGQLKPVGQYTGQDAAPAEHLAPNGSRAMDGKTTIPTQGPKASTAFPRAPRMDRHR